MALSRRRFLSAALAGAALSACARHDAAPTPVRPDAGLAEAIARTEAARPHTGRTVTARLRAAPGDLDLGGPVVRTLAYDDRVAGPLMRANVGDELAVTVTNGLDHPTSVHWHGIALRNDMDGAAPATPDIDPAQTFTYRFTSPIPAPTGRIRTPAWTPTTGCTCRSSSTIPPSPAATTPSGSSCSTTGPTASAPARTQLYDGPAPCDGVRRQRHGHAGHGGMPGVPGRGWRRGNSDLLGGDAGDVSYPYYLVNGRIPAAPTTFTAKPGPADPDPHHQRRRRHRVPGRAGRAPDDRHPHRRLPGRARSTWTRCCSGWVSATTCIVTAGDGVFPLVASAEGKNALARALLRHRRGQRPRTRLPPAGTRRAGRHRRHLHRRAGGAAASAQGRRDCRPALPAA